MEKYELEAKIALLENCINRLLEDRFKRSVVYCKIRRIISHYKNTANYNEHFEEEDRKQIFDYWWPNYSFPKYLLERYPSLSENDILLCCLLKLNFSVIEIGILLELTRDCIYKRNAMIVREKMIDFPVKTSLKKILAQF